MATNIKRATIPATRGTEGIQVDELTSTAAVVSGSAATLLLVVIDNTNNENDPATVKLYDDATPVVGTDDPEVIITCPKGVLRRFPFPEGIAFSTAITAACTKENGTAGETSLDNDVNATFYF